ncbi:MAG: quinone oxidoreductase [Calditrichota bacterium]
MKVIQVTRVGGPEVLEVSELPVPEPGDDEVVVKLEAAGVNYVDVYHRNGNYAIKPPFVPGLEGAGVVSTVGMNVKDIKKDDRIAWTGIIGSYAEYVKVPATSAVQIPEKMSTQQAAAAMLQGMTAHYLSHDTYRLKKGVTALIHAAAGGVGLLLVQMAHQLGARVIGTVSTEVKADLARKAGADEVILYTQVDFETETKKLISGEGIQVVYDSVGKTTFSKGLNLLAPRGMMVLFGSSSGNVPPLDLSILAQKGSLFVTRPSLVHYTATRQELLSRSKELFDMILSGRLNLRISHKYGLSNAAQAHRDLEARKTTGKLLLIP